MATSSVVQTVVRVRRGRSLKLPAWVIRGLGKASGGFVRLRRTRAGILLNPAKPATRGQDWFWTKEWQRAEREVDAETRHGRVRRSANLGALLADLRR